MWRYLKWWGTESGPASWVCGSLAGPHTQKAPVYKINSCKQQLCRGNICIQQNVPIVMDSWVLTNVTTTTIKIQNVSKKKKKVTERVPCPRKLPPALGSHNSHPSPRQPLINFLLQTYFVISRILQKWNRIAHICVSPLFPQCHIQRFIRLLYCWFFWFIFCCYEIWIHPSLSLIDGYLGGFQFEDFMSTTAVMICAQAVSGHMLSFLFSKYLEM